MSSTRKAEALADSAGGMLNKREIAERLGITTRAIDAWRKSGRFPAPDFKLGAVVRWHRSTLDKWLEKQRPR